MSVKDTFSFINRNKPRKRVDSSSSLYFYAHGGAQMIHLWTPSWPVCNSPVRPLSNKEDDTVITMLVDSASPCVQVERNKRTMRPGRVVQIDTELAVPVKDPPGESDSRFMQTFSIRIDVLVPIRWRAHGQLEGAQLGGQRSHISARAFDFQQACLCRRVTSEHELLQLLRCR
ncbi:hypothetical protein C8Q70DRAFT_1058953 [Cubamyces menziesii]|nr:hypothetical protein C8Q70DRAFT_1058953 [Cubamyces menziesii]